MTLTAMANWQNFLVKLISQLWYNKIEKFPPQGCWHFWVKSVSLKTWQLYYFAYVSLAYVWVAYAATIAYSWAPWHELSSVVMFHAWQVATCTTMWLVDTVFLASNSACPVLVHAVNFCWFDAMEPELSLLVWTRSDLQVICKLWSWSCCSVTL